ncbi:MBL fold metallo-hydrolase [Deinococcus yavapaiensis]|uniref:Glyoxylase-like metal-dependent hydrolase (Beta-lactamase superfamily II) n=1 Tax=Deinococcus yavapaiensis KR-236 TaxID=694435 RepID=A0A318S389_9DEIO|nr:MBL fold metallo-hydrolase [Deinococcus yavapaiensis]PYE48646.1 glyoxylase-like metal-dependent hydrolase (beta-lactamase superfamily II) [Deinococcus yavapaiensis KR-236]
MSLDASTVTLVRYALLDPRVLILRAEEEVDAFAVLTERFVLLLDTMSTPALAEAALDCLRPHLRQRPLLVLNTHADYDHAYGNRVFSAGGRHPTAIIGHRTAAARLTSQGERERLERRQRENARYADVRLVAPTVLVDDALTLDGGDLTLEVRRAPGHTDDHLAVWIPQLRMLLAGDAAEYPFPQAGGTAGLRGLESTLTMLAALDPDVVLACHGGTTSASLLTSNLAYFAQVRAKARAAFTAGGLPNSEVETVFAFEDALRLVGTDSKRVAAFYRSFHEGNVRAALRDLAAG